MKPIEVIYSFNDGYAELAAVSMTSLVYNTKRDCHIHIFENSLSKDTLDKIFKLEDMYANAKITVHHISDEKFVEVADKRFKKEAWYPLLAPEILGDLDKVLLLEPDTLVCRDISELYDIDLAGRYVAVRVNYLTIEECNFYDPAKAAFPKYNVGVTLYNLKAIRGKDLFNYTKLIETVKTIRPYYMRWLAQESYQGHIFHDDDIVRLDFKYNSVVWVKSFFSYAYFNKRNDFHSIYEAINNPVVIHFSDRKPNMINDDNTRFDPRFSKWWNYLALSPFANPEKDGERLKNFKESITRIRGTMRTAEEYSEHCLYFDMMEAAERLKEFSVAGMKIVIYGVGVTGFRFIRFVRFMNVIVDNICDLLKSGNSIDGIKIDSPEILEELAGEAVVVIAIENPTVWTNVLKKLINMGYPEKHILPLYEHFAVNGRKWSEVLQSFKL